MDGKKISVLFVCTGNIFRSMSAEHILKHLDKNNDFMVASAGTDAVIQNMSPYVRAELESFGVDPSSHSQTQLTENVLKRYDLVVAMSTDHKDFIKRKFGVDVLLFNEIALGKKEGLPDIWEAIPDYLEKPRATEEYMRRVVDYIYEAMPKFMKNAFSYAKKR
ncbi:MAG: low molecular weight phosphatase family protein [Candidatus Woesearchaeota archaeon]